MDNTTHAADKSVTLGDLPELENMALQLLFDKLKGSLPLVFDFDKPATLYSFTEWVEKIKRDDLISRYSCLGTDEVNGVLQNISLHELKQLFWQQLSHAYSEDYKFVQEKHTRILYEYYHSPSTTNTKEGSK